jgi:hypothetical protein
MSLPPKPPKPPGPPGPGRMPEFNPGETPAPDLQFKVFDDSVTLTKELVRGTRTNGGRNKNEDDRSCNGTEQCV